jgi:RimJ/RimL family protein N-acetyltransferase
MPGAVLGRGDRVTLRTVEPEDAEFTSRGLTNPELRIPMGNPTRNVHTVREKIEQSDSDGGERFLVCLDGDEAGPGSVDAEEVERIGVVSVGDVDWRRPDLGYWIAPEYQGEGYGKEAIARAIDFTFRTYDHPAVGAVVYEFNDASRGVLESLGFEEEGVTHRDRFIDGEYVDTYNYVLFREKWRGE